MFIRHSKPIRLSDGAGRAFPSAEAGMTLAEVLIAVAIFALVFGSVLTGLTQARYRAAWASLNLEAAKFSERRFEQVQNAPWDPTALIPTNGITSNNFPTVTVDLMDYTGAGSLLATNTVRIDVQTNVVSTTINTQYMVITSTVVWRYRGRGPFTNMVTSIRAPDQ